MPFLDHILWNKKVFNGQWSDASKSYDVIDKASSNILGQIGCADANSVSASSVIAKNKQIAWWQKTYLDRQNIFENAVKVAQENQNEIIDWLMKESGSLRMKAAFETQITIQILKNCISLPTTEQGQVLPSTNGKLSIARRFPLGVVGVISPFNFPLYLAMRAVAPALALGNAVILKPDERTAVCGGMIIARIFELAGLPEGLLHVLPGGADVGEAMTLDKNIASIQFTGSTAVGKIIAENAAKTLKKVSLELGGKNSLIILDDANIETAAANIAWGAFLHSGQICMTSGKILIHESIYKKVKNRIIEKVLDYSVGSPLDESTIIGPLIDVKQANRVIQLVKNAVQHGAKLEIGGTADGVFVQPTVLSDVDKSNPIFSEEIFGPVAVLIPFSTDEEAIALANEGDYGLSAGIITSNAGRGISLGQQLHVGLLHINDQTVNDETLNPFGGFGASGNGTRIGAPANIDEFTQWQWMTIQSQAPLYPL